MDLKMNSVYAFDRYRVKTNLVPPPGSNSFYVIKPGGRFNLECIRVDDEFLRFNGYIEDGVVELGPEFVVAGIVYDTARPYNSLNIKADATLQMDESLLLVSKGSVLCAGKIEMIGASKITVTNGGSMKISHDAQWIISDDSEITIDDDSWIRVYGKAIVPLAKARTLLRHPRILWDSSAEIDVVGLEIENRPMTLRKAVRLALGMGFSIHSSQVVNTGQGMVQVRCDRMDYEHNYNEVTVITAAGFVDLGDFRLTVAGSANTSMKDDNWIDRLIVGKGSILFVASTRNGHGYILPELYIGFDVNNGVSPGKGVVDGALLVDGVDAKVTLDRGGSMEINGWVAIDNGAKLIAAYTNDQTILTVNGVLVLENIESLEGFTQKNIQVGPKGRICILNKYPDENHVLYSIPDGFESSPLNQVLGHVLDHIQYHMQPNTGIEIDTFYDYYARDLRNWFGNRRIEDVVHTGHVVWDDGAFIKLNHSVTWWADEDCDLTDLVYVFKMSTGTNPVKRLNDVVNTLSYAGFGDVRFLINTGNYIRELVLSMKHPEINSVSGPGSDGSYTVETDADGIGVLMRDPDMAGSISTIRDSKTFPITNKEGKFNI